ncbi:MAG TPA: Asd/ArgC dimerization domain-containing protein [Bryobacteraceae bacterium]|nr:Asd/ArgC dimerization domain-containing protein [Bryobacteraceae bacterium]
MASSGERPLVAVVGGDTLLAREIRDLLGQAKPEPRVQLISAAAGASTLLAAEEDETVVMTPLNAESLEGSAAAFLAGSPASSRRTLKIIPAGGPVLIDLGGALEEQPNARLRAPSAEPPGSRPVSSTIYIIAHPAAIALSMFFSNLAKAGAIRQSVAHVFEPASERGQRGLDELQQQTVAVLNFQKLKMDVFDAQLGFNVLARYGEEALEPLEGIEQRLERHLATLLAAWPGVPMPSLRLIQAPVFHGHSISVWVEFEENPGTDAISRALEEGGLDVRKEEPPSNAGMAGQSGLSVGAIAVDSNHARACWFWVVADNLRLAAENAVAVAKELL